MAGMKDFFMRYILAATPMYPAAAINLLAIIGDEELMPGALDALVAGLKVAEQTTDFNLFTSSKAEGLAHRIYDFHLEAVRAQPGLMDAYRWLLERLIDLGRCLLA
jgi:hypothetical protein